MSLRYSLFSQMNSEKKVESHEKSQVEVEGQDSGLIM